MAKKCGLRLSIKKSPQGRRLLRLINAVPRLPHFAIKGAFQRLQREAKLKNPLRYSRWKRFFTYLNTQWTKRVTP